MIIKEENIQLNRNLMEKKAAIETDKSLEWSYKI
jgi:hypothetical protein